MSMELLDVMALLKPSHQSSDPLKSANPKPPTRTFAYSSGITQQPILGPHLAHEADASLSYCAKITVAPVNEVILTRSNWSIEASSNAPDFEALSFCPLPRLSLFSPFWTASTVCHIAANSTPYLQTTRLPQAEKEAQLRCWQQPQRQLQDLAPLHNVVPLRSRQVLQRSSSP